MKEILPARVRFGDFILDLTTGELCLAEAGEGDRRILLQEQPFKVLLTLIDRNCEIATREEIKKKLWPNDTVVEFDHHINVVIGKLRRALGDSAQESRYIETLARRGYRLMVPWERMVGEDLPSEGDAQRSGDAAPSVPVQLDIGALTGRTVSHYRVLDIIGGGGMGVVYRAEDLKLGRLVAVKFLPDELDTDPQALERFHREARTISLIDHTNICSIYEFGEHEGQPFMVMQLLQGQTLRDRLSANVGPLPLEELLDVGIHVNDGLRAAHERGIIHRDIKPANIFITDKGICKVLDFGLAKLLELGDERELVVQAGNPMSLPTESSSSNLTRTGSAMGTKGYMSPEQVRGEKLDARTDLFSFGLVLYEMATGQRAFSGETAAIVHDAILNQTPVPVLERNPVLPRNLVGIIDKALEKDRGLRYQSATEMRADLEQVRNGKRARARFLWRRIAAAGLLVTTVVISGLYWRSRNTTRLTGNDTIVLADFTNLTTDPVFDDALNAALRVELEQTPVLNLLAPDKIRGTLKAMHHSEDEKLIPKLARDVCVHTNSKAYVAGSIADRGNSYEIELRGVDCQTGKTFAKTAMEAKNREQVVKVLGDAGIELRREVGEPQSSLKKFNQPLDEATTSSLEALQSFAQSRIIQREKGDAESLPYLQRAVELDPKFAVAYCSLGDANYNLDAQGQAIENYKRAYALRDRGSARQRFYIEGSYFGLATGELEKAIPIYVKWTQTYPDDTAAHNTLSRHYRVVGRYNMAISEANESLRIRPKSYVPVNNLMFAYMAINRPDQAKSIFDDALSHGVDVLDLRSVRYLIAFLEGDEAAMQEQLVWMNGRPGARQDSLFLQSDEAAYHGRFRRARDLARRVLESSVNDEGAESWGGSAALREAEVGNFGRAREAGVALESMPGRRVRLAAAMVLARTGEIDQAQKLVEHLQQQFPLDTMMQNYLLPTIEAAIELQKKNPTKAIELLQITFPYELGTTQSSLGNLSPAYVRGQAYLDAGMFRQAETEFQKMLDHPGIVLDDVTGALAHLQLGRAQVMMGDTAAARKSYQDFLTLWKGADPDIPIYKQAKLEYARLFRDPTASILFSCASPR